MTAFYNEIDPTAAAWLRELISKGHIAPGIVDERSIEDIIPEELAQYTQCHFFAGIGVWSYALRAAGWPDDVPCWTGSCPCQPFSAAGSGGGFDDERHLWPSFAWLIEQCKPAVVFGEQVASKAVEPWVDLVHADLEALGYAFGAIPFPSAGVGAPHIRDRLFWVADTNGMRLKPETVARVQDPEHHAEPCSGPERLGYSHDEGLEVRRHGFNEEFGSEVREAAQRSVGLPSFLSGPGPTNGAWRNVDWISCRDKKWRAIEPGLEPLVNGDPSRVGRLRGYGNAINAQAAKVFIESYLDTQ